LTIKADVVAAAKVGTVWGVRGLRRVVGALLAACAAAAAGLVPAVASPPSTVMLLQLNLCNSGEGACFTGGRAVDEAATVVRRYAADVVTLQEICQNDVGSDDALGPVARAMADVHGDRVTVHFVPAKDPRNDQPYRCQNGQQFGNAVLHHHDGQDRRGGWFADWNVGDEIRSWGCAAVVSGRLTVCTTHVSNHTPVTVPQCRELFRILNTAPWVLPRVVVAGDINLPAPRLAECGIDGFRVVSDDSVQHVLYRGDVRPIRAGVEPLRWTDHPALYQVLRL
jgi:hypothetical protein